MLFVRLWDMIVFVVTFKWLAGLKKSLQDPLVDSTATKVIPVGDGNSLFPKGFGEFKQPATAAETKLQKAAVNALFDKLKIGWIPPQYWDELRVNPDPIAALRSFCRRYGISDERLATQDKRETKLLRQVVGILLDLALLKPALGTSEMDTFDGFMLGRQYDTVETKTRICRRALDMIERVEQAGLPYKNFACFRDAVMAYRGKLFTFTEGDVIEATEVLDQFLEFHAQFKSMVKACDQRITYLLVHWPDNQWGQDNLPVRAGIIAAKEEAERTASEKEIHPDEILEGLNQVCSDLQQFIEELQASVGDPWKDPPPDPVSHLSMDMWLKALRTLAFAEDAEPSANEIKKMFRKVAFKWHPDKNPGNPDAEQKFEDAVEALTILERGKPRS